MRLIDARPQRYHYVVAIGVDADRVLDAAPDAVARSRNWLVCSARCGRTEPRLGSLHITGLESMPDLASSRLALRPGEDRYAVADAAVVERATLPKRAVQWAAAATQAALNRDVCAHLPGRTGPGAVCSRLVSTGNSSSTVRPMVRPSTGSGCWRTACVTRRGRGLSAGPASRDGSKVRRVVRPGGFWYNDSTVSALS